MSWFSRLIPCNKASSQAEADSELENRIAEQEQATAINVAINSAARVAEIGTINYRNGFSVALGNAFAAKKEGTA